MTPRLFASGGRYPIVNEFLRHGNLVHLPSERLRGDECIRAPSPLVRKVHLPLLSTADVTPSLAQGLVTDQVLYVLARVVDERMVVALAS